MKTISDYFRTIKFDYSFLRKFSIALIIYYLYIWLFPTFRMLVIGVHEMQTFSDALITLSPDIFASMLLFLTCCYYISNNLSFSFFDKLFIFFFISNVFLGIALASDPLISSYGFRITYFPMLFYFIGKMYFKNNELYLKTLYRIILVFSLAALTGMVIYFFFPEIQIRMIDMTGNPVARYFILRMTSILWTPVLFGFLMSLAATYAYYRINSNNKNWLFYLFFLLFWVCLVLTVSRGAIIAFLITFFVLSGIFRNFRIILISIFLMATSVTLLYYLYLKNSGVFSWVVESTSNTISMDTSVARVNLWNESIQDFKERPWGYGLGKAGETAFRFLRNTDVPSAPYTTDGWYLKLACETGLYGLLSYLVLFGIFVINVMRNIIKTNKSFLILGLGFFIIISVNAFVNNCLDFNPYITIYWLVIGYCSNVIQRKKNELSED